MKAILVALAAAFAQPSPSPSPEWEPSDDVVIIRATCVDGRLAMVGISVKPGAQGIYTFVIPPTLCQEKPR